MSVEEEEEEYLEDAELNEPDMMTGEDHDDADEATHETANESGELVAGVYNVHEVNDEVFEELDLPEHVVDGMQRLWNEFLQNAESREAAGEAIYTALFDSAPSLQSMFKSPRAVMAMRFAQGLHTIIHTLGSPHELRVAIETLGFQHMEKEVTKPRVIVFRDAILDLLQAECSGWCTPHALMGWCIMLNYVGGAFIYVRTKYAERLQVLATSWANANHMQVDCEANTGEGEGEGGGEEGDISPTSLADAGTRSGRSKAGSQKVSAGRGWLAGKVKSAGKSGNGSSGTSREEANVRDFKNTRVPRTFPEMFMFNAAVMGYGSFTWMQEILSSFDTIVCCVGNSSRLQEECDVVSLRIAKYKGTIHLSDFKAVMLASLRSLIKDWGSLHEVSWAWLWENIERMLKAMMGKPVAQEAALSRFLSSVDDFVLISMRQNIYKQFFAIAPAGQDYFKQSTTRLHFIADKVISGTLDMYREPKQTVEDLSALGLRHVGYGIPTDLFGPFVTCCMQVVRGLTDDDLAEESFRWSLNLISRILQRVVTEGSTIVMQAINANSGKQLKRAVACAPRGQRAMWMLNVQVGTQSISPLMWAIETGSLDAARAIMFDLLTIRADRDRYYYGMDLMFERHPDIIRRMCLDAPVLLEALLDGLVWRARSTEHGMRRVNYYIKHLIVDLTGEYSKATEWIVDHNNPKIVCHPVVTMVIDMVWTRLAFWTFLYGRTWFVFTLIVFIFSQSILNHWTEDATLEHESGTGATVFHEPHSYGVRAAIFACRTFIYAFSMGQWLCLHTRRTLKDVQARNYISFYCFKFPAYLAHRQDLLGLCLTLCLVAMLCLEPILHCFGSEGPIFTEHCADADDHIFVYAIISTIAILCYYLLLMDLAVFSTRVSAFALVCGRVVSEVGLFLLGATFFVLAFASAISSLEQDDYEFSSIPNSALALYRICFGMFSGGQFESTMAYPSLFIAVVIFALITVIFLLNLLIAQLNCAYQASYQDMLGFARLNRGKIVSETMRSVKRSRFDDFVASLRLEDRIEFGEGDIGLAGGIQVLEPAGANITTMDTIRRFGGTTSPAKQWPQEDDRGDDEVDRFAHMERHIEKAMKRLLSNSGKRGGGRGGSSRGGSSVFGSALSSDQSSQGSVCG